MPIFSRKIKKNLNQGGARAMNSHRIRINIISYAVYCVESRTVLCRGILALTGCDLFESKDSSMYVRPFGIINIISV